MTHQELRGFLRKIIAARERSWQFGYVKNREVGLQDVGNLRTAIQKNETELILWMKKNMSVIAKVCTPQYYAQKDKVVQFLETHKSIV